MLDAHTIRALISMVATNGAKGMALAVPLVLAQWLFFGNQISDHERRIQVLETRVMGSYKINNTLWLRRECVESRREGIPIPDGTCDEIFREIDNETHNEDRTRIW